MTDSTPATAAHGQPTIGRGFLVTFLITAGAAVGMAAYTGTRGEWGWTVTFAVVAVAYIGSVIGALLGGKRS